MLQPGPPAETHDDHLHVRTGCDVAEMARGCEPTGPVRPWIRAANQAEAARTTATAEDDAAIARELLEPMSTDGAPATPDAPSPAPSAPGAGAPGAERASSRDERVTSLAR